MSAAVYDIVTERIIGLLERGVVPWQKPWTQRDGAGNLLLPQNLVSGRAYRGVNTFLLGCAGYSAPYWVSFKQALDLGGNVRKGEKSTPAIFWKILDVEDAAAKDGRKKVPMLRYYSVFNVEQCDGLEYPKPSTELPEGAAPFDPIATAAGIVAGMPKPPTLTHREPRAYYRPITDTVNMPAPELFNAPAAYYSTLFHELTHSTGHAARLARASDWARCAAGRHGLTRSQPRGRGGDIFVRSRSPPLPSAGPRGSCRAAVAPLRGRGSCLRLAARPSPLRASGLCAGTGLFEPPT